MRFVHITKVVRSFVPVATSIRLHYSLISMSLITVPYRETNTFPSS